MLVVTSLFVKIKNMRKLFFFQFLFLGIVFFTFSVSDVFATSCGTGGSGTCSATTACTTGTLTPDITTVCAGMACCVTGSLPTTITCPAPDFELKNGVCFPKASTIGLSGISVYDFLVKLMNWLLGILGILGVIAFVISGTQYLVSAGDEEMAKTAKRNMTYAVIGLVVALAGLIIVNAIAGLTGAGGSTVVY